MSDPTLSDPTLVDLSASAPAAQIFLVVAAVYFAACAVWAIFSVRKVGLLPVVLLAGGLIAALQEGPIDRMICLWYPTDSPMIAWYSMGVPQPLYMVLIYGGFVGGGSYVAYRALAAGRGARGLWEIFVAIVVMDALFEIPATAGHVYYYYGDLPFQWFEHGWAAYLGFISASAPVLAGWMLYNLAPHAQGIRIWMLALVPPTAWAAAYFLTGWPVYVVTGSGSHPVLTWFGALSSILLSCGLVWLLGRAKLVIPSGSISPATQSAT